MAEYASTVVPATDTSGEEPAAPVAVDVPDKFKNEDGTTNHDAVLKAYTELEKSAGAPAAKDDEAPATDETDESPAAEEVKTALSEAGLDVAAFTSEYEERGDGTLTDESMTALEAAGYPKVLVDTYLKGLKADTDGAAAEAATFEGELLAITGGEDDYNNVTEWAARQDESVYKAYNDAFAANDKVAIKAELAKINTAYNAAEGREPRARLAGGKNDTTTADVYASHAEARTAMQKARASKDPAQIAAVEAKTVRSPAIG
jgi:hypothetical protein